MRQRGGHLTQAALAVQVGDLRAEAAAHFVARLVDSGLQLTAHGAVQRQADITHMPHHR